MEDSVSEIMREQSCTQAIADFKITVNHLCSDFLPFIVDTHVDFDEGRPMWWWDQIRGSSHFWCAMENPSTCVYKGPGKQSIEN